MTEGEPQQPSPAPPSSARSFTVGEQAWEARLAGTGLGGTGQLAAARFVIVRFYHAGEEAARREALLPAGRFDKLYESELVQLLAGARPLES